MDLTYFYIAFATCFVALMIVIGYAMFLRIKIASFNHKASVPKGDPVVQRNLINSFQTGSIMPVIYDITSKSLRLLLPNQDGKIAELEVLFESPLPIGDLSRFTIGEDCDALISFFENLQAPNASRAFSVVARIDKNRNFHQYFEIVIVPKVM